MESYALSIISVCDSKVNGNRRQQYVNHTPIRKDSMNGYNSQMILYIFAVCFTAMLVAVPSAAKGEQDISKHLVKFTAAAQASPPLITLHLETNAESDHEIYRKDLAATSWGDAIARLPAGSTSYVDHNITIGRAYEYKITCGPTSSYVCSGINLPLVDYRGKVLLWVDATVAPYVHKELLRLQDDLTGDGWTVLRRDIDRDMPVADVKKLIVDEYNRDPSNVKACSYSGILPCPTRAISLPMVIPIIWAHGPQMSSMAMWTASGRTNQ